MTSVTRPDLRALPESAPRSVRRIVEYWFHPRVIAASIFLGIPTSTLSLSFSQDVAANRIFEICALSYMAGVVGGNYFMFVSLPQRIMRKADPESSVGQDAV